MSYNHRKILPGYRSGAAEFTTSWLRWSGRIRHQAPPTKLIQVKVLSFTEYNSFSHVSHRYCAPVKARLQNATGRRQSSTLAATRPYSSSSSLSHASWIHYWLFCFARAYASGRVTHYRSVGARTLQPESRTQENPPDPQNCTARKSSPHKLAGPSFQDAFPTPKM